MKAVVAAFNQEKALVGAFSVITNLGMQFGCNFLKHYTQGRLAYSHAHLGHAYYPGYPLRTLSYPASTSPLTVAYPSYPGYPGAFLGLRSPALFSAPLNVVQVRHTGNSGISIL